MKTTESSVYEQSGVAMTCRAFHEYAAMFQLRVEKLHEQRILDVAAGASSFVTECRRLGIDATAVDPLYSLSPDDIYERGQREIEESTGKLAHLSHVYHWDYYGNLDNHRAIREASLNKFLDSYRVQRDNYVTAALPNLPFENESFSLILCNHFLFLYHLQFDLPFHQVAIQELIRVCQRGGEVLIYPVATLARGVYPHLDTILGDIERRGCRGSLIKTPFRFLPSANQFLRIQKRDGP